MSRTVQETDPEAIAARLGRLYDLDPAELADPYPIYAAMRGHAPVLRVGPMVSVSRYDDVKAILTDPVTFSSRRIEGSSFKARLAELSPDQTVKLETLMQNDGRQLPQSDNPVHDRLRGFVSASFGKSRIAELREWLTGVAHELLDGLDADGRTRPGSTFDLIGDFTFHVPFRAICKILDVPVEDSLMLRKWGMALTKAIGTRYSNVDEAYEALTNFEAYVGELIAKARRTPGAGGLIGDLVQANDEGDLLTDVELVALFTQMLVSGNTQTLIANGFVALEQHPAQKQLLVEDRTLLKNAIEEFLRYVPSIHTIHRVATIDTEIAGFPVAAGETIRLMLASANHDEAMFQDAETLDVTRKNARRHLGLGHGIHTCLGYFLLRLDAEVCFDVLFDRLPALRTIGPITNKRSIVQFGPERLDVGI